MSDFKILASKFKNHVLIVLLISACDTASSDQKDQAALNSVNPPIQEDKTTLENSSLSNKENEQQCSELEKVKEILTESNGKNLEEALKKEKLMRAESETRMVTLPSNVGSATFLHDDYFSILTDKGILAPDELKNAGTIFEIKEIVIKVEQALDQKTTELKDRLQNYKYGMAVKKHYLGYLDSPECGGSYGQVDPKIGILQSEENHRYFTADLTVQRKVTEKINPCKDKTECHGHRDWDAYYLFLSNDIDELGGSVNLTYTEDVVVIR